MEFNESAAEPDGRDVRLLPQVARAIGQAFELVQELNAAHDIVRIVAARS